MDFSYFKRRSIRLVSMGFAIVLVVFLFLNLVNLTPSRGRGTAPTFRGVGTAKELVDNLNTYDIQVEFKPEERELICTQVLEYKNLTDKPQDRLFFHIYPNAFKYEEKTPFPREDMPRAYPNGFNPGSIDIISIKSEDNSLDYNIRGYSEEVLEVYMAGELLPEEDFKLSIEFKVIIPNCLGRFGYGELTYNITNWYPILSVYDHDGWSTYPYFPIGDPFYSEASNYRMRITSPKEYSIACTGNILSIEEEGDRQTWEIEAYGVRDFAFVASDAFIVDKKKVGKTTVYSYYITPDMGKKALKYAKDALGIFNKRFGKYPYNQFSVVEADFYIGGMEYPNLVLIDKSLYREELEDVLELVVVHETAHQWWYGVVGNNQIEDAWLDEGLTEFSTILYYRNRYGQQIADEMEESRLGKGKYIGLSVYTQGKDIDETIARPVYRFPDWIIYDFLVYGKGSMVFEALAQDVGEKQMYQILNKYYEDNMFKNVKLEDLIYTCQEITGEDYTDFFNQWLYDK